MTSEYTETFYVDLEQSIATRLSPLASQVRISVFPETPSELKAPASDRLLVGFIEVQCGDPVATQIRDPNAPILQKDRLIFKILVQTRNLRSHTSALRLIPKIRNLLTGFVPPGNVYPFVLSGARIVDVINNIWSYEIDVFIDYLYRKRNGLVVTTQPSAYKLDFSSSANSFYIPLI